MKPYSWEEVESVLNKELKRTKHIMTFGTIGSRNIEHDIDTIITKKPSSSSSEFYKEIHGIFDAVDGYLMKKHKSRVLRFALSTEELFIHELSKGSDNDLAFHTMIYTSFSQIDKDWSWALLPDENMKKMLLENYKCLLGSTENLFSKEFIKPRYYDSVFIYLYHYDKTNTPLSDKLLSKLMNDAFDYLLRKRIGVKANIVRNNEQARAEIYRLCDILDELESK